ncbi:3'(2'),5'-bisphosphate nucleotidase CysQ [Rhizobium sp. L1K21]|uniref:3'(2'),5'-bisphosphate nucleotidase CysQ n=1 Tax=Rhizobium sp. L1K21 TaxID=2954933 RepID=UPI00209297D2|nr:3'(2'),5'-bisphosphate nucleotidase CysQ [Rhizobium sp. L1K21]MCO6184708.1 3'(2'),5'-bisphosphate nucleotidase CysQ [Rhizobium sp. L1K21]
MLKEFERIAIAAGEVIMEIYRGDIDVMVKGDQSPVTEADQRAEALILSELKSLYPDIPVVAEEEAAAGRLPVLDGKAFILVDPLDGTKEFINRREDFTVNIALIENSVPTAGVVYAPARGVAYSGGSGKAEKLVIENGAIASRSAIATRAPNGHQVAVASRSHNSPETVAFLEEKGITEYKSVGSSLKFCLVAEGEADVYPRFGRTMEWDTAAGDAVLRAAGGVTLNTDGTAFAYGKRNQATDSDFANPHFVAWGKV